MSHSLTAGRRDPSGPSGWCAIYVMVAAAAAPVIAEGGACPPAYVADDGTADAAFFGGINLDTMWMNRMVVIPDRETIVAVDVCWVGWSADVFLPAGHPVTILLFGDPDGDGMPTDGMLLAEVAASVQVTDQNAFQRVPLPPTVVGSPGGSFFIAVLTTTPAAPPEAPRFPGSMSFWYPSCADTSDTMGGASWIGTWPAGDGGAGRLGDLMNLADLGYDASFMLRAVSSTDDAPGDLDCDGGVDGDDLGALLAGWGACAPAAACPADLDSNGVVDSGDLALLLSAWM